MSRKITLSSVLIAVLLVFVLASLGLCYRYVRILGAAERCSVQAQALQQQVLLVNRNRAIVQRLAADVIEYARKQPAVTNLLQQYVPLLHQLNLVRTNAPAPPPPPPPAASRPGAR